MSHPTCRPPPTILVLRALGVGDLLTAVPALRALGRGFPAHDLVLAAPRGLRPLIGLIDEVGAHVAVAGPDHIPWRGEAPEIAVNLHGCGPESHRSLLETRPGRLLAHVNPDVPGHAGPAWDPSQHETVRWCRLLESAGVPADPTDLYLAPPDGPVPDAAVGAAIVHPGAKSAARRWPVDRFAAVARHERRRGRPVLVTGNEAERPLALEVARLSGLGEGAVLAGETDLAGLARVVAVAGLVVCGDTGIAHLATGLRTPSVVLFGPSPPAQWGPPADPRHRTLWAGERGDPFGHRPHAGLLRIGVDEVLAAADRLERIQADHQRVRAG